ncbi:MAG: trypsin-like peptidase domain-containing protein [Bdellovibrionales bacterium]|jgi:V8-like Glu-specific endopeptidase|nr:trypsin-like peptidase domain-containing protein [Bdellovibrionales bacterium]MBT3526299.1 trypsin-like peptidase domain-containing protein [Bdellovibrionales bacterium]MBT7668876.1 trypsin-like peptidase domain-containing protein [Bdellovibrionales bacterium]MBT7767849.1 trypsin-like peptidase domain-containing protein [Bdellovibrionales bacterium]
MDVRTVLLLLALTVVSITTYANNKVIYGDDNRMEVAEAPTRFAAWADSTAAMISNYQLSNDGERVYVRAKTLALGGKCKTERFAEQMTPASCSGFLVGKDLLVTAGHCITKLSDCNKYSWMFGFHASSDVMTTFITDNSNVYKCVKVISRSFSRLTKNDYALVKLDRAVTGRKPLKLRRRGKVDSNARLIIIGHPTGLPTKIADGATVRKKSWKYFKANLDSYGGNSGSAVINEDSGEVEGILVRGDRDYVYDSEQSCYVSNRCSDSGCRGEDVTYIKNVSGL